MALKTGARFLYPEKVVEDARGWSVLGLERQLEHLSFNVSREYRALSKQGVVRGMHYQKGTTKLVRCAAGSILDVVVDLRGSSFGEADVVLLRASPGSPYLLVPPWCAHGYASVEASEVHYLIDGPSDEEDLTILWSSVAAPWPYPEPFVSERDAAGTPLAEFPRL